MKIMNGIQDIFKLKDDKIEEPKMYLDVDINRMTNIDGDEYWRMSFDK